MCCARRRALPTAFHRCSVKGLPAPRRTPTATRGRQVDGVGYIAAVRRGQLSQGTRQLTRRSRGSGAVTISQTPGQQVADERTIITAVSRSGCTNASSTHPLTADGNTAWMSGNRRHPLDRARADVRAQRRLCGSAVWSFHHGDQLAKGLSECARGLWVAKVGASDRNAIQRMRLLKGPATLQWSRKRRRLPDRPRQSRSPS
jgi:hypothetical protein